MKFDADPEKFDAQYGCCNFVARRENNLKKIQRIELSFAQKNKWGDHWLHYWFYVKVGHPNPLNSEQVIYPFASKMEDLNVIFVLDYDPKSPGYEACCDGFLSCHNHAIRA